MLKYLRRFNTHLIKQDVPETLTRVASQKKSLYELQDFEPQQLKDYFKEDALLIPVETIVEKSSQKDFDFFLTQKNFLKVVDTLEKFENGILDKSTPEGKQFMLFKRQLYYMYQVSTRSVYEHELYSFTIERKNLNLLYQANLNYQHFLAEEEHKNQQIDLKYLKGMVYRRKMLNETKFKGAVSLLGALGIYGYFPYISLYLGQTIPILAGCAATFYGILCFNSLNLIHSIEQIKDGEHKGKYMINYMLSPLTHTQIICEAKDVCQVLGFRQTEDLTKDEQQGVNVQIQRHFDVKESKWVEEPIHLQLQGEAFQNRIYLDWLLSNKDTEETTLDDFQDLLQKTTKSELPALDSTKLILARYQLNLEDPQDENEDQKLKLLQEKYGQEYLDEISDVQLFRLYRSI